jgi:hypothetical protein
VCPTGTRWRRRSVPESVPKRGRATIIRQPTPTNDPIKNGPEIVDFRPVLYFVAALANRRLQPLGHLTVKIFLTISAIRRWLIRLCSSLCSSSPDLRSSVHLGGGFAHHRLANDSIPPALLGPSVFARISPPHSACCLAGATPPLPSGSAEQPSGISRGPQGQARSAKAGWDSLAALP